MNERSRSRTVALVAADHRAVRRERVLLERQVVLHDPDRRDLEVGELGRVHVLPPFGPLVLEHVGLGVGGGVAGHVELHADLVELQRRQPAGDERARLAVQDVDVVLERVAGRDRDRVPEVVGVVALVVVAHAGVLADHRRGLVDAVGVDLRRDQRRAVAEGAGVEDGGELAQHAELLDPGDPRPHRGLVEAEALAERGVRAGLEREVPLDRVQQLAVEGLEVVLAGRRGHRHRFIVARRRPSRETQAHQGVASLGGGCGSGGPVNVASAVLVTLPRR